MLNSSAFKLGDKKIGGNARCLIIAEIGINHNGSYAMAIRMIDAAKEAGADAVKFQTFSTDALVTKSAKMAAYQQKNTKKKSTQWDLLKKCELNALEFKKLKAYCDRV